jgi:hypothetical protein
MTIELASAIVNINIAARELQELAASNDTQTEILKTLMEIRKFALEGIMGADNVD